MKPIGTHNYFIYILTNKNKTVLYVGVTNDIKKRLYEHQNSINTNSFTKRYNVFYLVYFEHFENINDAINREKQIKGWKRIKKNELIETKNPDWNLLNDMEF